MVNSKKKLIPALFFFLSIIFVFPAQASQISLDKSKIRLSIPPEGSQAGEIKIENSSAETVKVKVYLEDWLYKDPQEGTKKFFPKGTLPLSCSEWITFSPSELTLSPFGKQTVNYVVKVPSGVKGGHFSVMFFETSVGKYTPEASQSPEERRVGINVAVRIGALFYVEVKGTIKQEAEVSNLTMSGNTEGKPLLIDLDLKNIGNVNITTAPYFHIMDKQGMVHARAEFNEVYTMPGDKAKLSVSWPKQIPQGVYDLVITFNLNKAQEAAGARRGPVMIKETKIEIGQSGRIERVGELK